MKLARVLGTVVATIKHPTYVGHKIMLCQPLTPEGDPMGKQVVAVDHVQAGAGDHVLARIDVPGFTVEESPASRAGRGFVAANNKKIANEGQTTVRMLDNDGRGLRSVFQVAEVPRPLWSVGKICDAGFHAKLSKDKAVITDEAGREVLVFERKQGLYLGLLQVRNPKFKPKNESDFPRPSR